MKMDDLVRCCDCKYTFNLELINKDIMICPISTCSGGLVRCGSVIKVGFACDSSRLKRRNEDREK